MITSLLLAFLSLQTAQAGRDADACLALTNGDRVLARKCKSHLETFEQDYKFADACRTLHKDVDVRMRCLRSGANLDILEMCKSARWSLDGTLTCLRSYPSKDSIKICKQISKDEAEQLRCVRTGKESTQIQACMDLVEKKDQRFECLQKDVPIAEVRRCGKISKGGEAKIGCLESYMALMEDRAKSNRKELIDRQLASESDPIYADPKPEKK